MSPRRCAPVLKRALALALALAVGLAAFLLAGTVHAEQAKAPVGLAAAVPAVTPAASAIKPIAVAGAAAVSAGDATPAAAGAAAANPTTPTPQRQAAVAAAIERIQGTKDSASPDLRGRGKVFKEAKLAPVGGSRIVKDMLSGKLKALPSKDEVKKAEQEIKTKAAPNAPDGVAKTVASDTAASKPQGHLSSVVAAAMEELNTKLTGAGGAGGSGTGRRSRSRRRKEISVSVKDGVAKEDRKGAKAPGGGSKDPMHVHLGSSSGLSDLILDGVVAPAWNISDSSSAAEVAASLVPATKDFEDFFMWRSFVPGERKYRLISAQKPFLVVNDSSVLSVRLAAWGPRHMAPVPINDDVLADEDAAKASKGQGKDAADDDAEEGTNKKKELLFGIQFDCKTAGRARVTLVQRVFELTKGQRASEPLQVSFIKECAAPKPKQAGGAAGSAGDDDADPNAQDNLSIPGLLIGFKPRIGTGKDSRPGDNVVRHGKALPRWTASSPQLQRYNETTEGAKWWLTFAPPKGASAAGTNLTVNKAVFVIDDPRVLSIEPSGDLTATETELHAGRSYTLAATFTCKQAGESLVTVVLSFPNSGAQGGKVSFSFRKPCTGLSVGDGAAFNGVDIWRGKEPSAREPEVVNHGTVQAEWRGSSNLTAEFLSSDRYALASADPSEKFVVFFVKLKDNMRPVLHDDALVDCYTPDGSVIMRPKLEGALQELDKLEPGVARSLVLTFNCLKSGEGVVSIKIPLRPSGSLQFNMRKTCEVADAAERAEAAKVAEYSTGNKLTPLPGINVGHKLGSAGVVLDGVPSAAYHQSAALGELRVLDARYQFVNFVLWKDTKVEGAKDVRFGRPELISTAAIAAPVVSGLGAEGGLVTDDEYSTLAVTFHCFAPGNTTISLVIPLVGDPWLNADNEPVTVPPAREDPIRISFVKICPEAQEEPVSGLGGVGISGFSIGTTPNGSEVVKNGFPVAAYYGQRLLVSPAWDNAMVAAESPALTLYLHYDSALKNVLVGEEVVFQAPVVVTHDPVARPVLAGDAADGGVLLRDGPPIPLDLTFNCRYAGLAVVTVVIPIVPHGEISLTIPKHCPAFDAQAIKDGTQKGNAAVPLLGAKISGLHVGLNPLSSEVVRDGLTTPAYISVSTRKSFEHHVFADEETTTFWIRKERGAAQRALEPLIFAHRPIVNVRLTHALLLNSTAVDDDADGDEEIEIDDEPSAINITYACVHQGSTDITVTINLLPQGQIQWTFDKECQDHTGWTEEEKAAHPLTIGGIMPSEDPAEPLNATIGVSGFGDVEVDMDIEEELAKTFRAQREAAEQNPWGGDLDRDPFDFDGPDPAEASIQVPVVPAADPYANGGALNPHAGLDGMAAASAHAQAGSISTFQIGTGKSGDAASDVFSRSLPNARYAMLTAKARRALDVREYAVVKPDQEVSAFYLSTRATQGQKFGQPIVNMDALLRRALNPVLTVVDTKDGSVVPLVTAGATSSLSAGGAPVRLELQYNCLAGGVYPVGVQVPVGEGLHREYANFRVIKICPNEQPPEPAYFWTAGRMLTGLLFVAAALALAVGVVVTRRVVKARQAARGAAANTQYAPVQTSDQH